MRRETVVIAWLLEDFVGVPVGPSCFKPRVVLRERTDGRGRDGEVADGAVFDLDLEDFIAFFKIFQTVAQIRALFGSDCKGAIFIQNHISPTTAASLFNVGDESLQEGDGCEGEGAVFVDSRQFQRGGCADAENLDIAHELFRFAKGAGGGFVGADEGMAIRHALLDLRADIFRVERVGFGCDAVFVEFMHLCDLTGGMLREFLLRKRRLEIDVRDALRGANGADLRRIEGAAARADTVCAADFADREEMAEVGFPP